MQLNLSYPDQYTIIPATGDIAMSQTDKMPVLMKFIKIWMQYPNYSMQTNYYEEARMTVNSLSPLSASYGESFEILQMSQNR